MYSNVFCLSHSSFNFFVRLPLAQPLLKPIPVNHRHVDQILNVAKSMDKQSVHVFLDTLEDLRHVDRNVLPVRSALKTKLATTKNVLTLALEPVVLMQNAKSETTVQSVLVHQAIQAILLLDVKLRLFSIPHLQILVNHLLVGQMLNVESLENKLLVHVFLQ
jgi:hypothetical protein